MAGAGVRCLLLTRLHRLEAGIPSSREKAYITRELQVTADNPQNHIAITTSAEKTVPALSPRAVCKMVITAGTSLPPASFAVKTDCISLIARVSAMSSRYPTTLETTTAIIIPQGARRRGSTVSSDTLADASYPVKVHCACNSPMMNAHQ